MIRHYGVEGLRFHIRDHVALAQDFAAWVSADSRFELAAPAPLTLVCFRHTGGDQANQAILDRLNASGELFLTHTKLDGRLTLRMSIGQTRTEERHVRRAWELIRQAATELEPAPRSG
ncbi:MAG: pyridoxal-dependent decarboxylase [Acidimicrobiia bacterium]